MSLYDSLMESVIYEDSTEEYKKRRSLNEAKINKNNLSSDWSDLATNEEDKVILKANIKRINQDMVDYIYKYYSNDFIKDYMNPSDFKKIVNKNFIKQNFVVDSIKPRSIDKYGGFSIFINADWNEDFLKNDFKKIHDDHILSAWAEFDKNNKYLYMDMQFDG